MKRAGVLAALCALFLLPAGVAAADAPAAPAWSLDNPFCDVLAAVVPSDKAADYGVALYARNGTKVEAHVTLIGADSAYDAHVPVTNLAGDATDRHTEAAIVRFPVPATMHYFFVDSYAIDGTASVTCPSYVFRIGGGPNDDPFEGLGLTVVTPALLQALPALSCGKVYTAPDIKKGFEPIVGRYGNAPRDVLLHVYVDSDGNEVRASLKKPSGVEGLDDAALAGVQWTRYSPATFLCMPVVSELDMEMDYKP